VREPEERAERRVEIGASRTLKVSIVGFGFVSLGFVLCFYILTPSI
jgi:hypothetical protein